MPRPRSGGLHHVSGSPGQFAGGCHGPCPLRLVSMTKWVVGSTPYCASSAWYRSLIPSVFRVAVVASSLQMPYGSSATPVQPFEGPPFQYWLGHSPVARSASVTSAMQDEIHVPYCTRFSVHW